jgi:hypothetical protein
VSPARRLLSQEGWLSRRAHVVTNLLLPGFEIDRSGLTQVLVELGRQIQSNLTPNLCTGDFMGGDGSETREKQSMKFAGRQACDKGVDELGDCCKTRKMP